MASPKPKRAGAGAGAVALLILVTVVLALTSRKHGPAPVPIGVGCEVRGQGFIVQLDPSQAAIAATIAGVALHRDMPTRAVTIAYAAALQESDLENLSYGDRDSVGVFQQRPSQGWGTRQELLDPIYATDKFFAALLAVPHYQRLPVYQAAQAVQRSADGSAYGQYSGQGAIMADAFTGRTQRSFWCWYGTGTGRARLAAAGRDLTRAFGPLPLSHIGDPSVVVTVQRPASGWAVANWLVSNAGSYGIRVVRYEGFQWTAGAGTKGWTKYHVRTGRAALNAVQFG